MDGLEERIVKDLYDRIYYMSGQIAAHRRALKVLAATVGPDVYEVFKGAVVVTKERDLNSLKSELKGSRLDSNQVTRLLRGFTDSLKALSR